jgi:hypothetical protein
MVTKSGQKLHIIIPKFYHQDILKHGYLDKVIQVEVRELDDEYDFDVGFS